MARGKLVGVHKVKAGMMLYIGDGQWRKIEKVSRRGTIFGVRIQGRAEPYHLKQDSAVRVYRLKSKPGSANHPGEDDLRRREQIKAEAWIETGLRLALKLVVAYVLFGLLLLAIVLLLAWLD